MSDLIDRQAAIEAMRKAKDKSEAHRMLVQLPSAQPTGTNTVQVEDCISREAALTALERDEEYDKDIPNRADGVRDAIITISALPSAQPECEDAVSRQTLKDGFTEMCNLICPYSKKQQHVMCGSCLMGTAFDVLEATPPVTPKQPGWIPVTERLPEYGTTVLTCDHDGEYEINHIIDEEDGEWFWNGAVAWIPIPKPWEGDANG